MATTDTKTKLLRVAAQEFGVSGYDATSVRDICTRAEANIASVNYYYGDKRGLYEAVADEVFAEHNRRHEELIPDLPNDPEQLVRKLLHNLAWPAQKKHPFGPTGFFIREVNDPTTEAAKKFKHLRKVVESELFNAAKALAPKGTADIKIALSVATVFGTRFFLFRHRDFFAQHLSDPPQDLNAKLPDLVYSSFISCLRSKT